LQRSWIRFTELAPGGTLEFTMGSNPNSKWGSATSDRPPSFDADFDAAPEPLPATAQARPAGVNVALHKPVTADGSCAPSEGPEKAVNGSVSGGNSDKWCSLGPHAWLRVDLGAPTRIMGFVIHHAGAGWEDTDWNTKDFDLQLSQDGAHWQTVVQARGNTKSVTVHSIEPRTARYARLEVLTPERCCGTGAARIYEFEIYAKQD